MKEKVYRHNMLDLVLVFVIAFLTGSFFCWLILVEFSVTFGIIAFIVFYALLFLNTRSKLRVKFVITNDLLLKSYYKGKLQNKVDIKTSKIYLEIETVEIRYADTFHSAKLIVVTENKNKQIIYCSELGRKTIIKMYEHINKYSLDGNIKYIKR